MRVYVQKRGCVISSRESLKRGNLWHEDEELDDGESRRVRRAMPDLCPVCSPIASETETVFLLRELEDFYSFARNRLATVELLCCARDSPFLVYIYIYGMNRVAVQGLGYE